MSTIVVTQNGQTVDSITSDPVNPVTYRFTASDVTGQPLVGYTMNMAAEAGAVVTASPFSVYLPLSPDPNTRPFAYSQNSSYIAQCSATNSWYLQFSIDMTASTQPSIFEGYHLGTADFYIVALGLLETIKGISTYQLVFQVPGSRITARTTTPLVTVRFQFPAYNGVSIIVNGGTVGSAYIETYASQNVQLKQAPYLEALPGEAPPFIPLTISNIVLGLPPQTYTPVLQINKVTTPQLYQFIRRDIAATNLVIFSTPTGQISTGLDAPIIRIDQFYLTEYQSSAQYTVTQIGTIPPIVPTVIPEFPDSITIKELIPFYYAFSTTNYYPLPTSTPSFFSTGATRVSSVGTTHAVITIPYAFTDIKVTSDRIYPYPYLYDNNVVLSIALPYFTDPVDAATIGFGGPFTGTITARGRGSNTLTFGTGVSAVSLSYTSSKTLTFVTVPPLQQPPFTVGMQLYLVDSAGHSNAFPGGPIYFPPPGFPMSFVMNLKSLAGYGGVSTSTTINAPLFIQVIQGAPIPVALDPFASGTPYLLDYASGNGTTHLTVSSEVGFSTLPPVVPILFRVVSLFNGVVIGSVETQLTILQGVIVSSPDIYNVPPPAFIYIPFGEPYVFSVPKSQNTTLVSYNSDPIIRTYLTANNVAKTITFNAPSGFTSAFSNALLSIQAIGPDGIVSATINYTISVSSNILTSVPPFTGSLTLYKYEPFLYTYGLIDGVAGLTLNGSASSLEVRTFITPTTPSSNLVYSGSYNTSYANIVNLIVSAKNSSNATVVLLSNAVIVNPGRFYNPVSNVFSFYQYEDVAVTYGGNLAFDTVAPLDNPPTSSPSLPIGLSFASLAGSSNNFILKGTPQFQSPSNQYLIVGFNNFTNQTVTKRITIVTNPPRIKITPAVSAVTGMRIGVPIDPVTFTSVQPSALTILDFQYDWDALPDGLVFRDINGNVVNQPYRPYPADPTLTMTLTGTPTSNAAYAFVNSGTNISNVNLYAFQYQPKGVQTNQKAVISFSFGETILFDNTVVPPIYATQTLTPSTLIIKASSYFPTGDPIVSISTQSLPTGLSTINPDTGNPNYVNQYDYADGIYLSGTAVAVSTGVYTFSALSLGGFSRNLNLTIPILQDVVTFSSVTPASVVFIVSRPITLDYTLVFTAASPIPDRVIQYTTSFDITQYGLVLKTLNGSATLTGTPTQPLPSTTLFIIATDTLGTFAQVPLQVTINADQFTFNSPVLDFIQSVPITPVQFIATTSSQRQVISYRSSDLPQGLSLSISGRLTGTLLFGISGSFHVTASTGYPVGGTTTFSYNTIPDNIVTLLTSNPLFIPSSTFSVDAFRSFTYSGFTPTLLVANASIKDKNGNDGRSRVSLTTTGTQLNGIFASGAAAYSPFTFSVIATYSARVSSLSLQLTYNGTTGSLTTSTSSGNLRFTSPGTLNYLFYQHCPIVPIEFRISGATGFTYFYSVRSNLPVGLMFTPDLSGTFATLSGTPAVFNDALVPVTVYAVNGVNITFLTIQIRIITPFFVNPQDNGTSAYTALLRNQVTVNAAQNARDTVVFPTTDASLGYLQSPGAPDVKSPPVPCCEPKHK
jgi:hypothetical protein